MRRPLLLPAAFGLVLFLTVASKFWQESERWPVFSLVPKGWLSVSEPFLKPRRVSDTHTSPTHSLAQDSSNSWVVRSGQQDDQPWPNTKKGYSTSTSTHTWRWANAQQTQLAFSRYKLKYLQKIYMILGILEIILLEYVFMCRTTSLGPFSQRTFWHRKSQV